MLRRLVISTLKKLGSEDVSRWALDRESLQSSASLWSSLRYIWNAVGCQVLPQLWWWVSCARVLVQWEYFGEEFLTIHYL